MHLISRIRRLPENSLLPCTRSHEPPLSLGANRKTLVVEMSEDANPLTVLSTASFNHPQLAIWDKLGGSAATRIVNFTA